MIVLVINAGSSSIKFALWDTAAGAERASGQIARIGDPGGAPGEHRLTANARTWRESRPVVDHAAALAWLADQLRARALPSPVAIGHRVVHGGTRLVRPTLLDAEAIAEIERCAALAPLHNPPNLAGIRVCQQLFPNLPQVAIFDTAFHATLPDYAYRYAIPARIYRDYGARRYGFHGISHQYVSEEARRLLGPRARRLITCHLGAGASVAAILNGRCIDTSMGMTPVEGLVMATRSGDLDPALIPFVMRRENLSPEAADRWLNRACGLGALAGGRTDMRDIEAAMAAGDADAALAFRVFCYRVRKYIGAYAAVLGGLDALVFTAGIGENSSAVRAEVCRDLSWLGVRVDPRRNERRANGPRAISPPRARVAVYVIPTREEALIARETARLLSAPAR